MTEEEPLLIYDGDCGFCTETATMLKSMAGDQIMIAPWQAIPEKMETLGLTDEDGMTEVWFARPGHKAVGGAEAANLAMRHVWWARPLTYLYYVPGIKQLEKWLYRWVARNRSRLPGSTDSCAMPQAKESGQRLRQ
jgi:predicted DCC family thiol-disulfide oxidoreductase YuxK